VLFSRIGYFVPYIFCLFPYTIGVVLKSLYHNFVADGSTQNNEANVYQNRLPRFYSGHTYALALKENTYAYSSKKCFQGNDNEFASTNFYPCFLS
jgi:hypothetical protein